VNVKGLYSAHPRPFGRNEQAVVGREIVLELFRAPSRLKLYTGIVIWQRSAIDKSHLAEATSLAHQSLPLSACFQEARMSSPRRRILCAESHDDTSLMIKLLLEQEGYEVRSAATVAECLELTAQEHFDLYLLDDRYPDGTGVDLCQRLHRQWPLTPIMFFTAAAYEWNREAGISAGARAYILKPADINGLVETVHQLVSDQKRHAASEDLSH
jgi:CheY-like chemotaxis protein